MWRPQLPWQSQLLSVVSCAELHVDYRLLRFVFGVWPDELYVLLGFVPPVLM